MRKFRIINKTGIELKEIKSIDIIELIPVIKKKYNIGSVSFRCIKHKIGSAVLTNDSTTLYLTEIFN